MNRGCERRLAKARSDPTKMSPGVRSACARSSQSSASGVANYYATRPIADMIASVNARHGTNITTIEGLLAWLDLENRNAHMHHFAPPSYTPMNCGEVERIN